MCTEPLTPLTWQINFLNVTLCIGLNYIIFVQPCKIACSTQRGPSTLCHTLDLPKLAFSAYQQESFLHISNHWATKWPTAHLHISLFNLFNLLISANSCPGWHNYSLWGLLFHFYGSVGSKMSLSKDVLLLTLQTLQITLKLQSVIPKLVYLITVQEVHKEYNSLTDQIRAKYKQLDSGEYGAVGTPVFNAEACELANLLAHVSQLWQQLNLPPPKELYQPTFFKHWRWFLVLNYRQAVWLGYGGCSFGCRYLRITGLLRAPF